MKLLSWNARGLGSAHKHRLLADTITAHRPVFVALQESRYAVVDPLVIRALSFSSQYQYQFSPAGSGLGSGEVSIWD